MAYLVKKKVKGKQYLYKQKSFRVGSKVKTESQYLGPVIGSQTGFYTDPGGQEYISEEISYRDQGTNEVLTAIQPLGQIRAKEVSDAVTTTNESSKAFLRAKSDKEPAKEVSQVVTTTKKLSKNVITTKSGNKKEEWKPNLKISVDLGSFKQSEKVLYKEYSGIMQHIASCYDLDLSKAPQVVIKHGLSFDSKSKGGFIRSSRQVVTVPIGATFGRNKFRREYRRALGRATLDFLKTQKPEEYRKFSNRFYESYKASKKGLANYLSATVDRMKVAKVFAVKQGYYKQHYKNRTKPEQLGRVDKLSYRRWSDEFASIMAEVFTKGFWKFHDERKNELKKASRFYFYARENLEKLKGLRLVEYFEKKRAVKRAKARLDLNLEMMKKIKLIEKFL